MAIIFQSVFLGHTGDLVMFEKCYLALLDRVIKYTVFFFCKLSMKVSKFSLPLCWWVLIKASEVGSAITLVSSTSTSADVS